MSLDVADIDLARGEAQVEHGRYSTYNNYDCRCGACRRASRAYSRARKAAP